MGVRYLCTCVLLAAGLMIGAGCGKGDYSTPMAAARTFATALENGDAETAKKACTGGDPKMVESLATGVGNFKKMSDAAIAKFGDQGKTVFGGSADGMGMTKNLEGAVEKIDGDKATVTAKDGKPMTLKKVDGDWKVDVSEMAGAGGAIGTAMFDGMGKAAKEVTDDINAGKYKSAAEAKAAFSEKAFGGLFHGMKP